MPRFPFLSFGNTARPKKRRGPNATPAWESLEPRAMLSAVSANFDFGTAASPAAAGYTKVTEATMYSAAAGYGWLAGTVAGRDRGTGDALARDFNFGSDITFAADLPAGTYQVTLRAGDARYAHDLMAVSLEGGQVDTVTTAAGQVVARTYTVAVADGQLTVRLRDLGGADPSAVLNALEVAAVDPPDPSDATRFDFGTSASPAAAGYTKVTEASKYSAAAGYGWATGVVASRDRGTGDALTRDLNFGSDVTFAVDLPDGTYSVTLRMGDAAVGHDLAGVYLEGALVDTVTTAAGQVAARTYTVAVADGQLTVRLRDLGGADPNAVLNALEVDEVTDPPASVEYFVSTSGSDAAAGTGAAPFRTIARALAVVKPGETVIVLPGTYAESLVTQVAGTADQRIVVKAQTPGTVLVSRAGRLLDVRHAYYTFEGFVFDGQFASTDLVSVGGGGDSLRFASNELRNGRRDGVDIAGADDVLIEDSTIHALLWFEGGVRNDAHGVVTVGGKRLTIRDTEIYYVSGDALQLQYGSWDAAVVDSSHFWNGPLPASLAALVGTTAGANTGENGIDTKQNSTDPTGRLTVTRSTFNGWHSDFITNAAALNVKQNVDVVVDANTFFDNEIALRLRGPGAPTGARVLVTNSVFHDNTTAVRYEDGIQNLRLFHNTFGLNNARFFQSAGGYGAGFSVRNNLFLAATKPAEAADPSNLAAAASAFVDATAGDYRLQAGAAAVDAAVAIPGVTTDRDGRPRPDGLRSDVGAYEFDSP